MTMSFMAKFHKVSLHHLRCAQVCVLNISALPTRKASDTRTDLKEVLKNKIIAEQERIKKFRKEHGNTKVGEVTIDMMYGGMRGIKGLVYETSLLDAVEGIRFRGLSIPECKDVLPKAEGGCEPLPEGIFYLLLTGDVPTECQTKAVSKEWTKRAGLPHHVTELLTNIPSSVHPMSQFIAAITACNSESCFARAYSEGVHKSQYWEYAYEDVMNLLANLPLIAATIYNNSYKDGAVCMDIDSEQDWSYNFAKLLGFDDPSFTEMLRLYLTLHSDHEGGNVSAHAVHLVGSALSDPYLSFAAGMCGLAGPLHGLANQEVLVWLGKLRQKIGDTPTEDQIKGFIEQTLQSGQVVPGFGHAVLRKTDPRYLSQREFAERHFPDYPLFKIVSALYKVAPPVLQATGKVKNPWPNVDAHSGVLMQYYGLTQMNFYTVNGTWALPGFVCDFYIAMDVTCSTSSIFNLVAISIDRYIAVTQPIKYAKHKNTRRVWLTIALVWVISAAIGSPIVLGLNNTPDRVADACLFYNSDFLIYSSLSSFYIPCTIMVFLYYSIFKALRERALQLRLTKKPLACEIKPGSVIENVANSRRLAETTLGPSADEQPTNTGSGSAEEEEDDDGPAVTVGEDEEDCHVISNDKSTEFILATVVEEAAISSVVASLATPSPHHQLSADSNGNNDVSQPVISPRRKSKTHAHTKRNGAPLDTELRTVVAINSTTGTPTTVGSKKEKKATAAARFTIYKVNKASRKKREKSSAKKERKATKTLAIVLGVFLICWLPFFTCNILDAMCAKLQLPCQPGVAAFLLTTWLGYMNSFVNPVIYTIFNPEFRKAFKKIMFMGP